MNRLILVVCLLFGMTGLASAQDLDCELYDIATAQVLVQGQKYLGQFETEIKLEYPPFGYIVTAHATSVGSMSYILKLTLKNTVSGEEQESSVTYKQRKHIPSGLWINRIISEVPYQGDTLFWQCRILP